MSAYPPGGPASERWAWVPRAAAMSRGPFAWLDLALMTVAVVGLAAMTIALIIQVFSRYFFSSPTVWSEEFALLVFVWVAMLGIALAVRRGEHLALDLVNRALESRAVLAKILAGLVTALVVITLVIIAAACIQLLGPANRQSLAGIQTGLGIPAKVSWIYAALPVGLGIAVIFAIERYVLLLVGKIRVLNADADQQVVDGLDEDSTMSGKAAS